MPNTYGSRSGRANRVARWLAIAVAGVLALLLAVAIVGPLLLSDELARERIAEQIEQWTGRTVTFAGEPHVSLLPRPRITLSDVRIADTGGDGALIAVEEITGTMRLLPLLTGRIEIGSFILDQPTFALSVDEAGTPNWLLDNGTIGERISAAFDQEDADPAPNPEEVIVGEIKIRGGVLTYQDPAVGFAEFSDINLDIAWADTSAQAELSGDLVWRGERVEVFARVNDPLEVMAGRTSAGRFDIIGDLIQIAFDGTFSRTDRNFGLSGATEITLTSLREVIRWAGEEIGDGATLGRMTIDGQASWTWPLLTFSDVSISLNGNRAGGAASIEFGGERLAVGGTLALDSLDLSAYADSAQMDLGEGEWVDTAISLPIIDALDTDIRISADRLIVGDVVVEAFAASMVVNDGMISARLGESDFYGGTVRVTMTGSYQAPFLSLEGRVMLSAIDAGPALRAIADVEAFEGFTSADIEIAGAGERWGELLDALTGGGEARITGGTIEGLDLSAAAALDGPTVSTVAERGGATDFTEAVARVSLADGRLIADTLTASGEAFSLRFGGWGSLTTPDVGGDGTVSLRSEDGDALLPFQLVGTWLEPRFIDPLTPPLLSGE